MIEEIKKHALTDQKNRRDRRYKDSMAFLVKKGLLKSDMEFEKNYPARLNVQDLIWAGRHVEPRILEVLPVAVAKFPKSFSLGNQDEEIILEKIVKALRSNKNIEADFFNIPFKKIQSFMKIPLEDGRTKTFDEKKVMKTFRLSQKSIEQLKTLKNNLNLSEAGVIELIVNKSLVDG